MDEIKNLLATGMTEARLQEIGFEYTLAIDLYKAHITKDEFLQKFVEKNWQYAKKQIMWLKRNDTIQWFAPDESNNIHSTVRSFLDNSLPHIGN